MSPGPSACALRLAELAAFSQQPTLTGPGGCGAVDVVKLEAVTMPDKSRVSLNPPATLRCSMAEAVALWVRQEVWPAATELGSALSSISNFDSYDCRGRNRIVGARLSEHGKANALDVRAIKLANGKMVDLTDPLVSKSFRERMRTAACGRFMTVLGPGSDGYHENHIHVDLAERTRGYRMCQWDVREPPVLVSVPLPRAPPDRADRRGRTAVAIAQTKTAPVFRQAPFQFVPIGRSVRAAGRTNHRHTRVEWRVALALRQHDHRGAEFHAVVEVDHVLIGHADAARGDRRADVFRLVGAVNAVQRVLVALA